MNTAVRHVETDALDALRSELVRAAGRGLARRRRRRRAATLAAAALALLALAAGAAAVGNFSTGVQPVDELLEVEHPGGSGSLPVGGATDPIRMDAAGGGEYQLVAFLSRNGNICIASADRHRGGVRGGFGCAGSVDSVNRRLERHGGMWSGSGIGADSRTNRFLVDGDVESVRPLGEGDWTVRMTPPWTPQASNARPLRLVVVVDDADIGNPDDGVQPQDLPPEAYDTPKLELTYGDGRTRVFEGPQAK
jgi:hypothetical protein